MADLPKGLDPRETNGTSGETSKTGLYVFEPKNSLGDKLGEQMFLEANDPAQADAFIHMGYRQATLDEVKDYVKKIESAKKEARAALTGEPVEVDTLAETRATTARALEETAKESKQAIAGTEVEVDSKKKEIK